MEENPQSRFLLESIQVEFDQPPLLEKKPRCPDRFVWAGETYAIVELVSEWSDYRRRGRMSQNMRPENAARARQRGSWGVGRYHYQVKVADGRVFEIYYDRAPSGPDNRKGSWVLSREIVG